MKLRLQPIMIFFLLILVSRFLFPVSTSAQMPSFSDMADSLLPPGFNQDLTTPVGIINTLLPNVMIVAGLILFGMLIWGGFQMLTAAGNPKAADAGKARLTTAILGFFIVFAAYWLTQIVEIIFGVNII